MKAKKILIGLLCAAMTASCLVGCGGDSGSSDSASTGGGGGESASGDSGELATLRVLGEDFSSIHGSQEIHLSDWVNGESKLWDKVESDLADRGVQLECELILTDQMQTTIQTRLAAGINADIMKISTLDTQTRLSLVDQGRIIAINDIWENHSDGTAKEYYTSGRGALSVSRTSLADGKMYWLSEIVDGDYNGIDTGSPCGVQFRLDWMETLGIETPTTAEEFKDMLQAFQDNDINGNGERDEVASFSMEGFGNGIAQWFGLGTNYVCVDVESGQVTSPWYQTEQVQAYINYMKSLVDAGLLDTSGQESEKRSANKISAACGWGAVSYLEPVITVQDGADPAYLQVLVCEAMDGVKPLCPIQDSYMLNPYLAFTSECENLDALGAYLDYICTPEFEELTEYGIEGYTFTRNEDGSITRIMDTEGNLEVQRMNSNLALWGNSIFPRMYTCDREAELKLLEESGYPKRADAIREIYSSDCATPLDVNQLYAPETEEELTRINEITTDLATYSSELLSKLILGQQSMDDWDTYIADLQRLGLDELIEINQARYDRAQGN